MILGFKPQFNQKIFKIKKRHTIRTGFRWKAGMVIQFYNYVRTKRMKKFWFDHEVESVQPIEIRHDEKIISIWIDGVLMSDQEIETLAENDGFDSVEDLFMWFHSDFKGQIIHWTEYKY